LYPVINHPSIRRTNNIDLVYTVKYLKRVNGVIKELTHTEHQPYEITWCGDGVRDEYTDLS
jgi:hypothetical protein